MTGKRFIFREINENGIIPKIYDKRKQEYANLLKSCEWLNALNDENEQLKHKLQQQELEYATDLHRLANENEQLKSEINMLKTIIGRNEGYIDRLTHKGEWR